MQKYNLIHPRVSNSIIKKYKIFVYEKKFTL
jgi:hypothetical protein